MPPATITPEITALEDELEIVRAKLDAARAAMPALPVENYTFQQADSGGVTLSELFGERDELLVIHNMGRACAWCTLWADGFNGIAHHLENRTAVVIVSADDPATQQAFAASRGWRMRLVSAADNTFTHDMGFEPEPGTYRPGVSAFRKNDAGTIERTTHATFGPGDEFCSAWHLFDLLPNGVNDWAPRFEYK